MGDAPLVMNQTRGALWGGKCGDLGRGGFVDDAGCALLVMSRVDLSVYTSWRRVCEHATRWGCAVHLKWGPPQ